MCFFYKNVIYHQKLFRLFLLISKTNSGSKKPMICISFLRVTCFWNTYANFLFQAWIPVSQRHTPLCSQWVMKVKLLWRHLTVPRDALRHQVVEQFTSLPAILAPFCAMILTSLAACRHLIYCRLIITIDVRLSWHRSTQDELYY